MSRERETKEKRKDRKRGDESGKGEVRCVFAFAFCLTSADGEAAVGSAVDARR
jgi:hypothetical protein